MGPGPKYNETIQCAGYWSYQAGTYVISAQGVLIRTVFDWEPKRRYVLDTGYSGHYEPNARPAGGTWQVTFTSPTTMVWRDLNLGGVLTFRKLSP